MLTYFQFPSTRGSNNAAMTLRQLSYPFLAQFLHYYYKSFVREIFFKTAQLYCSSHGATFYQIITVVEG